MRIGIDARLASYRKAGISRYTLQLIEALQQIASADDEFIVLQGKRAEPILPGGRFSSRRLFTPCHHRLEQLVLPLELRPLVSWNHSSSLYTHKTKIKALGEEKARVYAHFNHRHSIKYKTIHKNDLEHVCNN